MSGNLGVDERLALNARRLQQRDEARNGCARIVRYERAALQAKFRKQRRHAASLRGKRKIRAPIEPAVAEAGKIHRVARERSGELGKKKPPRVTVRRKAMNEDERRPAPESPHRKRSVTKLVMLDRRRPVKLREFAAAHDASSTKGDRYIFKNAADSRGCRCSISLSF